MRLLPGSPNDSEMCVLDRLSRSAIIMGNLHTRPVLHKLRVTDLAVVL